MTGREWLELDRVEAWPSRRERLPHAPEAERLLIEHLIPDPVVRVLDLGTGEGHLLATVVRDRPGVEAIGVDLSPAMVAAARDRFATDDRVEFEVQDLMEQLPVSSAVSTWSSQRSRSTICPTSASGRSTPRSTTRSGTVGPSTTSTASQLPPRSSTT